MTTTIDIDQIMIHCPFEEARFAVIGQAEPQLVFLVRERSATIRYLGDTRLVLGGRLYVENDCLLVAVLLRVGRHLQRVYSTWWNYRDPLQAAAFDALLRQDLLAVHFYGDNGRRERSFVAANSVQACFEQAVKLGKELPAWSDERFAELQSKILAGAGSLDALWHELDQKG